MASLFCADLASQYQMMALQGYKRTERYFSRDEMEEAYCLSRFIVDHLQMLPDISVDYTAPPVAGSIKDLLECKMVFYNESLLRLKKIVELSYSGQRYELAEYASCMATCQERSLVKLRRCYNELVYTGWDKAYAMMHSERLHRKFKKKEAKKQGRKIE